MLKIKIVFHRKKFLVMKILENIWKNEECYTYSFVCIAKKEEREVLAALF